MESKLWQGMEVPEKINIEPYWSNGCGMSYLREGLPHNHPENLYNYVKNQLHVPPEAYGIYHPLTERFKDCSRDDLIARISELEDILSTI